MNRIRVALSLLVCGVVCAVPSCRPPIQTVHASSFDALPPGASWTVNLDAEFDFDSELSPRERREQARDWLLAGVVHRFGFDAETVARSTGALPAYRVAGVPTGAEEGLVRSAWMGNGEAVVLLPVETPEQAFDRLAEVADRLRGRADGPARLLRPFEYSIEHGETFATIRCLEPRSASEFYGPGSLYTEMPIRTAGDVGTFASEIADLTWASIETGDLVLGGRRLKGSPYRGVDLLRLAGLYQADRQQRARSRQMREEVHAYNQQWGKIAYSTEEERIRKVAEADKAWRELSARLNAEQRANPRAACGFSLDPVPPSEPDYQLARYDCPDLAGTEAAMTFFYGDLLAKLWALDYQGNFPQHIIGFHPYLRTDLPPAMQNEVSSLNHTRVWFGPRDGAAVDRGKTLALNRTATRVFAKSSSTGEAADEQAPNPAAAAFIGWWNDHYEEVALWEPEYQRLNQLVKWAFLFSWLEHADADDRLDFLYQTPVRRDFWFPDWARLVSPDLRFQQWDRVQFHERGYRGNATETMAVLSSQKVLEGDTERWVSGGVSPPGPAYFNDPHPFIEPRIGGDLHFATGTPAEALRLPVASEYRDAASTLEIATRAGGAQTGSVQLHSTPEGLWVVPAARSQSLAQRLAGELSSGGESASSQFDRIADFPGVGACVRLPEGQGYLVRFQGESRWLKAPESSGFTVTPDAWLTPAEANPLLASGDQITILPKSGPMSGAKIEIHNRGPPEGQSVALPLGDSQIRATRDASGGLHLPRSDLPGDFQTDLPGLARLTASSEAADLVGLVAGRDYTAASDMLARKPELAQQVLAARDGELSAARDALHANNPVEAARKLERLARAFPDDPDVLGALALAHAQGGDALGAAAALNAASRAAPMDADAVARLLEIAPSHTPLTDSVAAVLRARPNLPGDVTAIETSSGLGLRITLPGRVRLAPWTKASGAPYVIPPGYFSPEWVPPLNTSLDQLPGVKIPDNLMGLSPMVIDIPATGQRIWRNISIQGR
jgi:hypothetical protein